MTAIARWLALPTWPMTALVLAALLLWVATTCVLEAYSVYHTPEVTFADWAANCWEHLWQEGVVALAMLWLIGAVSQHGPQRGARRIVALVAAVVAAGLLGLLILIAQGVLEEIEPWQLNWVLFARPIGYATLAALLTGAAEIYRREVQSLQAMRTAEADREALERETLQARLQVLQAQIEPHFLFNTLANVRRLYDLDARAGRTMLEQLMRYLEVALPAMRAERSTLAREATLIDAYLHVQQVRMGRRLAFAIDIAAPLRGLEVPPMMLLTLVENAVKHGLAPLREGGRIEVSAHASDSQLTLAVTDDGNGFGGDTSGSGTGLANIRARLAALHGDGARLELAAHAPRGVRAALMLPLAPAT